MLSVRLPTLDSVDYQEVSALRERHPAWRLLRAGNATLILSFLGEFFVEGNRGACSASEVAGALDEHLYALNAHEVRYPKEPRAYLEDWAATEAGYLRRFYPPGDDEVHYEVTPAFEKSYSWVLNLRGRSFVGTESRLHTVVELLRQIVHGTEVHPEVRTAELRRRRAELDAEIASIEAGNVPMLDATGVRDRYQQLSATARELLADFREVEDNFRLLDRAAREKIAAWEGAKGELLAELVGSRSEIAGSDQGRSFQAFYDFLLSNNARQSWPICWPRLPLSTRSNPISGATASRESTMTGRRPPTGRSARSGRSPNSCDVFSTIKSGWRTAVCWTSSGQWRRPPLRCAGTRRPSVSRSTSRASKSHCPSSVRCISRRWRLLSRVK